MYLFRTYKENKDGNDIHDADGTTDDDDLNVSLKDALRATSAAPSTSDRTTLTFATSKGKRVDSAIDLLSLGIHVYATGPQVSTSQPQI